MFYQNTRMKMVALFVFLLIFISFLSFGILNNNSQHLIRLLAEKSFPFEIVLLEGAPGYPSLNVKILRGSEPKWLGWECIC